MGKVFNVDKAIRVNKADTEFLTRLGNATIAFLDSDSHKKLSECDVVSMNEYILCEDFTPMTIDCMYDVIVEGNSILSDLI